MWLCCHSHFLRLAQNVMRALWVQPQNTRNSTEMNLTICTCTSSWFNLDMVCSKCFDACLHKILNLPLQDVIWMQINIQCIIAGTSSFYARLYKINAALLIHWMKMYSQVICTILHQGLRALWAEQICPAIAKFAHWLSLLSCWNKFFLQIWACL